jgi:hypothetical protein
VNLLESGVEKVSEELLGGIGDAIGDTIHEDGEGITGKVTAAGALG